MNALDESSNARIASLEQEIASKEKEYKEKLDNAKNIEEELLKRIKVLSTTENELREKVLASETEYSERLQLAAVRDREMNEKLSLATNEILVLRSPRGPSAAAKMGKDQPMILENEVQSWRSVLEMKQKEISELQKQNHELDKNAAALPGALAKISALESRLEDLTTQLKIKNEEEQ